MADPALDRLMLDSDAWTDAPQGVIDLLRARAAEGLVIDASAAWPIPAQIAQLLLAARLTARAAGKELRLADPSAAVRQSLAAIGLDDLLTEVAP